MQGFEDSFNANGRRQSRIRKNIQITKPKAKGTPLPLANQLANEASKGTISEQANQGWSNIDGFDNASGKKFSTEQKIGLIIVAAVAIVGGTMFAISKMNKKTA